ncbi:MAG: ankyrin repeat domain-containing protein [Gammaproteobacteria bacterium]|nr:ankyrin repeat domain-containing protein [Gammaproteobacteria bacterium]MCH9744207.1 ankyrin repeat domain-containing protein [Gammaproteobacteria bacterium]
MERCDEALLEELLSAVMLDNSTTVEALIRKGVELDSYEDQYKERPLHFAVTYNAYKSAEALLMHGADMDAKSIEDVSPFDIACRHKSPKMTELFERYRSS